MFKKYNKNAIYIIAEIGGNFTTLEEAKLLIDLAVECKVDAIKLQTYRAETHVSNMAMFNMENVGETNQLELLQQLEVSEDLHKSVFDYTKTKDLDWFSTPSHWTDVELLEELNVGAYKLGSDDATNIPFLKRIAGLGKPMIVSTGMCTTREVDDAVDAILSTGNHELSLLHAITNYPTHPENVNLRAMETLKVRYPQLDIGYSDHTTNNYACLAAASMGARILEKHFTYDKNAEGPDHMVSADPIEMKDLVKGVRQIEKMLGHGIKMPAKTEALSRINSRKSIVVTRDMKPGEIIKKMDMAIKRPGTGITPKFINRLIGKTVCRNLVYDEAINWEDLE